jgi:hypothetical protein
VLLLHAGRVEHYEWRERQQNMTNGTGLSAWRSQRALLVTLPLLVILLNLIVWTIALSRSAFWADDFLNVTYFYRSLGNLTNDHINAGRYVLNVFWAVGTYAFGSGSAIPFLIIESLVFAIGVGLWLKVGASVRWSSSSAVWICGLFIATAVWYQTALLSSAIGHACGYLALGLGLMTHERCMRAVTVRSVGLWSIASGAAWTLAIVSNVLYLGLLPIAAYCTYHQIMRARRFGAPTIRASIAACSWNLVLPLLYFELVAYPATTSKAQYATNGLRFIHGNLSYYKTQLAPTTALVVVYATVIVIATIGAVAGALRKDWFAMAVLVAAGTTALPALVQSEQRGIFYLGMPLLLTFSAVAAGLRPVLLDRSQSRAWRRPFVFLGATTALVLLFAQGADVRSYFVQTPFGDAYGLAAFRSQVAALTPEGGAICAKLSLDPQQQALFSAAMSGEDGFLVPPISAAQAYLISAGKTCPAHGAASDITVSLNARGDFVAAG